MASVVLAVGAVTRDLRSAVHLGSADWADMIYPIAAILLLWFLLSRADVLPRLSFRMRPGLFEKAASIGAVLAALLVLIRGNVWVALILFGVALWLLGRASRLTAATGTRRTNISRVRSAMIEMDYDQRTGAMSGIVIAGPFEGTALAQLDRDTCDRIYRTSLRDDLDGARLLEAYFDRRFAGWRRARDGHADAGTRGASAPGRMSEDEAYEVLGLRPGASRDEIVRSHRTVMKKWHPDQGGTADLAARANEAKEVLLRRHA